MARPRSRKCSRVDAIRLIVERIGVEVGRDFRASRDWIEAHSGFDEAIRAKSKRRSSSNYEASLDLIIESASGRSFEKSVRSIGDLPPFTLITYEWATVEVSTLDSWGKAIAAASNILDAAEANGSATFGADESFDKTVIERIAVPTERLSVVRRKYALSDGGTHCVECAVPKPKLARGRPRVEHEFWPTDAMLRLANFMLNNRYHTDVELLRKDDDLKLPFANRANTEARPAFRAFRRACLELARRQLGRAELYALEDPENLKNPETGESILPWLVPTTLPRWRANLDCWMEGTRQKGRRAAVERKT